MIPLITVTCTRDKWSVLLQAHSIEKFVKDPTVHYIIVQDESTLFMEWRELLNPIYKKHKLVLLNNALSPDIFCKYNISSYDQQQFIKLKASKLINDEYYLSLDSKNIFFKPISLDETIQNKEGSGDIIHTNQENNNYLLHWRDWMSLIESRGNVSKPDILWFAGAPFLLKTANVNSIINTIDLDELFLDALNKNIRVSEYVLYSYFSQAPKINWDLSFGCGDSNFIELKNNSNRFCVFNMYRRHLSSLKNRETFIQFFIDSGLEEKYVLPAVNLTTRFD